MTEYPFHISLTLKLKLDFSQPQYSIIHFEFILDQFLANLHDEFPNWIKIRKLSDDTYLITEYNKLICEIKDVSSFSYLYHTHQIVEYFNIFFASIIYEFEQFFPKYPFVLSRRPFNGSGDNSGNSGSSGDNYLIIHLETYLFLRTNKWKFQPIMQSSVDYLPFSSNDVYIHKIFSVVFSKKFVSNYGIHID